MDVGEQPPAQCPLQVRQTATKGEMSDFPHQVQVGLVEDGSLTSVNTLPRLVRASATNPSDATVTATGLPSITW